MKEANLNLRVVYSGAEAEEATIHRRLQHLVEYAADNGLLTNECDMEVEESDFTVSFGADPVRAALQGLVSSYDDTGCEGCGVVDESAYQAAKAALGFSSAPTCLLKKLT